MSIFIYLSTVLCNCTPFWPPHISLELIVSHSEQHTFLLKLFTKRLSTLSLLNNSQCLANRYRYITPKKNTCKSSFFSVSDYFIIGANTWHTIFGFNTCMLEHICAYARGVYERVSVYANPLEIFVDTNSLDGPCPLYQLIIMNIYA